MAFFICLPKGVRWYEEAASVCACVCIQSGESKWIDVIAAKAIGGSFYNKLHSNAVTIDSL